MGAIVLNLVAKQAVATQLIQLQLFLQILKRSETRKMSRKAIKNRKQRLNVSFYPSV